MWISFLAPETTGIGFNSTKELELMKQLYDVDKLFNEARDISEIRDSFINIADRELKYRNFIDFTYLDVLKDIESFALAIIYRENAIALKTINTGLMKIKNYIFERDFLIDNGALVAASKVLYLCYLIRSGEGKIEKFDARMELSGIEQFDLPVEYRKRLKSIKKSNKEAYYYITATY